MESLEMARRLVAATDLVAGLAAPEVETRLQIGLRLQDAGHRILAFYLADMDSRRLYQALGFKSVVFYGSSSCP